MITLTHFLYINVYIFLFWGIYKLLLQNEKQFRSNRIILLLSLPLAIVLPFGHQFIQEYLVTYQGLNTNVFGTGFNFLLQEIIITPNTSSQITADINYPLIISLTGSAATVLWLIIGHLRIVSLIRKSKPENLSDLKVNISTKQVVPFSYYKSIVIPSSTPNEERKMIIMHEASHIHYKHYLDTYLLQIFQIIFWMNPFFYLLKRELKQVHEYEVDQHVINSGIDAIHYKVTLVKFSVGSHKFKLANGLTNYPLKKRLIMINNPNQKRKAWKYLMIFPVVAISVAVISACSMDNNQTQDTATLMEEKQQSPQKVENKIEEIVVVSHSSNVTQPVVKVDANGNRTLQRTDENGQTSQEEVFMVVEKMPQFPGGTKAMMEYLATTVKYPVKAQENGIQGRVFVSFIVDKDGNIVAPSITRGVDPSLDMEALRVVKSMPNWTPGVQRDKQINVSYTLPINFVLK